MKVWITIFILFLAQAVYAEGLKEISETKSLSEKIMQHFLKEEFTKGLDIAKVYWPLPPVKIDSLANQINTQWTIVRQRFGNQSGMELIKQEKVGKSFIRYYYLHKFDNHAIYWKFTYYKPKNEWKINGITYKDDLDFLFE